MATVSRAGGVSREIRVLLDPARLLALAERGVLAGVSLGRLYPGADELKNGLVVAVTEVVTDEDIETLATALQEVLA